MVSLKTYTIQDGFLEEEVREGYLVTKKRKEIWAVELDLLKKFINVCNENGFTYCVGGGTLLGTVRHGGFIPWDDDIDVFMPRKDYTMLCEISSECFDYPYFWQTEFTDPGCMRPHAQLRNCMTTAILKHEYKRKYKFNQGIFVDIFPLDEVPPLKEKSFFFKNLKALWDESTRYAEERNRLYGVSENNFYSQFEKFVQKYNNTGAKQIGELSFEMDNMGYIWDARDFATFEIMKFESLDVAVPRGYKNILRRTYGIWKEFVMGDSTHGDVLFDTDESYKKYVN